MIERDAVNDGEGKEMKWEDGEEERDAHRRRKNVVQDRVKNERRVVIYKEVAGKLKKVWEEKVGKKVQETS